MIEIQLDENLIQESVTKSASEAVAKSLAGWEAQKAIGEIVTRQVAEGSIAEAIKEAAKRLDTQALVEVLAKELQRATTKAVVLIVHESVLHLVAKMRGIDPYQSDYKEKLAKLKEQLGL